MGFTSVGRSAVVTVPPLMVTMSGWVFATLGGGQPMLRSAWLVLTSCSRGTLSA